MCVFAGVSSLRIASVYRSGRCTETGLGALVDYGDDRGIADAAARLAANSPAVDGTVEKMVRDHSWDARAALYDELFAEARDASLEA